MTATNAAPSGRGQVLCVNAGSSTMKLARFEVGAEPGEEREVWRWSGDRPDPIAALRAHDAAGLDPPHAVGHRVVHGGPNHARPALVDPALVAELRSLVPLAPLHEPAALAGIEAVTAAWPGIPQVACFDTAFHQTLPEAAARFPLPARLWDDGLRRYGFHGLSYEYVVARVGAARLGRAVLAHLGQGASLCAVADGRSVDTSMGLTPTGGVVMGTRSGDLDPGLLVHLLVEEGYDPAALDHLVNREAGLLGLSGRSGDMRELLAARAAGDRRAGLAVEVFCRAVRKQIGAYAAVLGGIDTLVFTAGIGERSAEIRAEICAGLEFLGLEIDEARNTALPGDPGNAEHVVSPVGSAVTVLVVHTDEDRMIARHVAGLLRRLPSR